MNHMRQHEQGDHQRWRIDDVGMQQQERQRRSQEDQSWNARQEVEHGVDIAQPLSKLQPFTGERVIETEDLHHPARPANTLTDMRRQTFGRQPRRLRNTHICRGVATTVQTQRSMRIFGYRFDSNAANLIQRLTANHRT